MDNSSLTLSPSGRQGLGDEVSPMPVQLDLAQENSNSNLPGQPAQVKSNSKIGNKDMGIDNVDTQGIKAEIPDQDESLEHNESQNSYEDNYNEQDSDNSRSFRVERELRKCKGRLDAFGNQLKVLCAQMEIVTGWIHQQFGITLINKESIHFKHIYDFEEIEEISEALSLLSHVQNKTKSGSQHNSPKRKRGRPGKKGTIDLLNSSSLATPEGRKRGRKKKVRGATNPDEELNPQDFLETIYTDSQNQNHSKDETRPKRTTRKKVNYQEDKDMEMSRNKNTKSNSDSPGPGPGPNIDMDMQINSSNSDEEQDQDVDPDSDFSDDPEESQELEDEDFDETKLTPRQRVRREPRRRISTKRRKKLDSESIEQDPSKDENQGDSDGQPDENLDLGANKGKTRSRKRYPKKPGVVWNSSLPKQCDECGKVLKGTSTLKLHKMMHADERPHACSICGNKFRFKRNLKVHMMAIHTGERPLQCSFCGRKFYASKDLRIHERTHTGEKPFPCSVCQKRFNVKEHLTMHFRVHTGERPYKCDICEKAFSQANSLRIHKKIHQRDNGAKPRKSRKDNKPKSSQTAATPTDNLTQQTPIRNILPVGVQPSPRHSNSNQGHTNLHQISQGSQVSLASSQTATLLSQMTPSNSTKNHSQAQSSISSSPMPAHLSINPIPTTITTSTSSSGSNSNPNPALNKFIPSHNGSQSHPNFTPQSQNFHQQTQNSQHHPQNPFIVPVPLNESWRMQFDHHQFATSSGSNSNANARHLTPNSNANRDFGVPLGQQSHSHSPHVNTNVTSDPRFHSFYSQNQ